MKRIISLAFLCLYLVQLLGQNLPQGIAYQAVAVKDEKYKIAGQNPQSVYWANKVIQVRFTIYDKFPGGTAHYTELHNTRTDDYGIFNLVIGQGSLVSGNFSSIPWDLGTAHLQVEIDFNSDGNFKLTTLERFWSVPYAFVSKNIGSSSMDSTLNTIRNKLDKLSLRDQDTVVGNEIQSIFRRNDTLYLTNGGGKVFLESEDSINELQTINKFRDTIKLDKNGGFIKLNDDDSLNEIQEIFIKNDSLFLSRNVKGIAISSIQKKSNSSPAILSPIIVSDANVKYNCGESSGINLGINFYSLDYTCEARDSIYYFGSYRIPNNVDIGSFVISKSKKNCGSKIIYKSGTSDWGNLTWGVSKNKIYFSKAEKLIRFDLLTFKLSTVTMDFPSNGTSQSHGINMGIPRVWSVFNDTGYIVFNRLKNTSSGSFMESHRLYKFNLNTGQIINIDSVGYYGMFDFSQTQLPVQYMDSVIFYWNKDTIKMMDFRSLNQIVVWKNIYNKYSISPNKYFHVYAQDKLILEIRTGYTTANFLNMCLIYDLKTNASILDNRFYGYQDNYNSYWSWIKRSIGSNKLYLVVPDGIGDPWNRPIGYLSPPEFYYP